MRRQKIITIAGKSRYSPTVKFGKSTAEPDSSLLYVPLYTHPFPLPTNNSKIVGNPGSYVSNVYGLHWFIFGSSTRFGRSVYPCCLVGLANSTSESLKKNVELKILVREMVWSLSSRSSFGPQIG